MQYKFLQSLIIFSCIFGNNLLAQNELNIIFQDYPTLKSLHDKDCHKWYIIALDNIAHNLDSISILTTYYPENRGKRATLSLDNGQLHGKQLFYYPNGKLERALFYHKNNLMDSQVLYDSLGNMLKEIRFENQTIVEVIDYAPQLNFNCGAGEAFPYANAKQINENSYEKMLERNIYRFSDKDINSKASFQGVVRKLMSYEYTEKEREKIEKRLANAKYKEYYDIDEKLIKFEYRLKNGKYHGLTIEYFLNGNIRSKINYRKGKLHGAYIQYYENGNIKLKEYYKEGVRAKDSYYYNIDGSVEYINRIKNAK